MVFFQAPMVDQQGSRLEWGWQQQKCAFQWSQVSAGIFPEDHKCPKKIDCQERSLDKLLGMMEGSFHCHLNTLRTQKSEVITGHAHSQGKCEASHKEPKKGQFPSNVFQRLGQSVLSCVQTLCQWYGGSWVWTVSVARNSMCLFE